MEQIFDLFLQFGQLVGVAAAIAALVNVFKAFGLVKDGDAGKWAAALNLVALAVLVALKLFAPAWRWNRLTRRPQCWPRTCLS